MHRSSAVCLAVLSVVLGVAPLACSTPSDTPATDGGQACALPDGGLLDPAHDECTQPCSKGNELKVGMYCTASGNECDYNDITKSEAYLCTLSQEPTADLAMCTKKCEYNEQCGSNAVCTGDPSNTSPTAPRGCVPSACTSNPGRTKAQYEAALDGGPGDAG